MKRIETKKLFKCFALIVFIPVILNNCSLQKYLISNIANDFSHNLELSFMQEEDPEIVEQSLPFTINLVNSMLVENPDDVKLLLTSASLYVMYANAFVQSKANMTEDNYALKEKLNERAKKLYLHGRNDIEKALLIKKKFSIKNDMSVIDSQLNTMSKEDVPYLYWLCAAWMLSYSLDAFNIEIAATVPKVKPIILKALKLESCFNNGAIHEFLLNYYASMPKGMGQDFEKAEYHFKEALKCAQGLSASVYFSYAETITIKKQDSDEFKAMLNKAINIDVNKAPDIRLQNILAQEKAVWYLEHIDDFFF